MKKTFSSLLFATSLLLISACSNEIADPDTRIRNVISAMEAAVEKRSIDDIKDHIDTQYSDEWNGSRRSVLRSLMFYYQGHQSIHLLTRISDISINDADKTATAIVYVGMAGNRISESEALINLNADLYRFDISLIEEDDIWRVKTALWKRARPEDFGL